MSSSLPRRIWVVGPCGSGKSTLADILAVRLGVPATHLDELHWLPGWIERPDDEMAALLEPIAASESWVIDGNYGRMFARFGERADLIVWIDFRRHLTVPRLIRRTFERAILRRPCCNGNHESFLRAFFSRESVILWEIMNDAPRRRRYEEKLVHYPHIRFGSPRDVHRWLRTLSMPSDGFRSGQVRTPYSLHQAEPR